MRPTPGTYILLLRSTTGGRLRVGELGRMDIRPGWYLYVGSAFGPGGVAARVMRHAKPHRRRWHVDYLRSRTALEAVWITYDPKRREHLWAEQVGSMRGASVPLRGFGASDCGCESHLFFLAGRPSIDAFRRRLRRRVPDHAPVRSRRIP